jgi:L-rhamnose mutarotase
MRRFGRVIGLKPEDREEYERIHAAVWPGVLQTIAACNIRNYSIFRYGDLLIAYFEYHGDDWEADQATMAADPVTRDWWKITDPMQQPVPERAEGEWWHDLPEVFHTD